MLSIFLLFISIVGAVSSHKSVHIHRDEYKNKAIDCYKVLPNHAIKCAPPYESQTGVTSEQCQKLCLSQPNKCNAAVFKSQATCCCYLYNWGGVNGPVKSPIHLVRYIGRKRRTKRNGYRTNSNPTWNNNRQTGYGQGQSRQAGYGQGQGGQAGYGQGQNWLGPGSLPQNTGSLCNGNTYPKAVACNGYTTYIVAPACSKPVTTRTTAAKTKATKTTIATTEPAPETTEMIETTEITTEANTEAIPEEATCPEGTLTRFVEIVGYKLVVTGGDGPIVFDANSAKECYEACQNNRLPDGTQAPCRSVNYDQNGECSLTLDLTSPEGTGDIVPDADSTYYEKICVDEDIFGDCPVPFRRDPEKILVGHAQDVVESKNFNGCLEQCVTAVEKLGFECFSGMYVFEDSVNNCILNSETAQTRPEVWEDNDDSVNIDYFEPRCLGNKKFRKFRRLSTSSGVSLLGDKQKTDSNSTIDLLPLTSDKQWGPWATCNPKTHKRTRFRQCKSTRPTTCSRKIRKCKKTTNSNRKGRPIRKRRNRCNLRKKCCPRYRNGTLDCTHGRQIISGKQVTDCQPKNC